jgi:hypothetical protein
MTDNAMDANTCITDGPSVAAIEAVDFTAPPVTEGRKFQEKSQASRKRILYVIRHRRKS